jgi:hypothetical protein
MENSFMIILLLLNAILVGVGIYVSAYLKKKAQNLATREEFSELKTQTADLTRTTGLIQAEIKGDLWSRQKQWETRKDAMFKASLVVGKAQTIATQTETALGRHEQAQTDQQKADTEAEAIKQVAACRECVTDLAQALTLVGLVAGMKVIDAFVALSNAFDDFVQNINNSGARMEKYKAFNRAIGLWQRSIRNELGIVD